MIVYDSSAVLRDLGHVGVAGIDLVPALSAIVHITSFDVGAERPSLTTRAVAVASRAQRITTSRVARASVAVPAPLDRRPVLAAMTGVERVGRISGPVLDVLGRDRCAVVTTEAGPAAGRLSRRPVGRSELSALLRPHWAQIRATVDAVGDRHGLPLVTRGALLGGFASAAANILRSRDVLDRVRPDVVLVEHDRRLAEAVLCAVARQRGIPTVTLVHGVQGNLTEDIQWTPLVADSVVVWGDWMADAFADAGVARDRIGIGGYPRLSPLPPLAPPARPRVVYLSASLGDAKPAVDAFLAAAKELSGWDVAVRPHPRESLAWYRQRGVRVQDSATMTMEDTLASASVVVGVSSTACLDAALLGVPTVLIAGQGGTEIPLLDRAVREGLAVQASAGGLTQAIRTALEGPGVQDVSGLARALGAEAAQATAGWVQRVSR